MTTSPSKSVINAQNPSLPLSDNNNSYSDFSQSPIKLYCQNISDINKQNENGWTPIYRSIIANNLEILSELLKFGADPNISNNIGETPLYLCVDTENFEALELLLKYNANCNISKRDGNTPLHLATKKCKNNFIIALLENNADPNLQNKLYSQSSFHLAIKNKISEDVLKCFKKNGANLYEIKDKYEKSSFDYAKELNDQNYLDIILNIFGKEKNNDNLLIEDDVSIKENCNNINLKKSEDIFNINGKENESSNDNNKLLETDNVDNIIKTNEELLNLNEDINKLSIENYNKKENLENIVDENIISENGENIENINNKSLNEIEQNKYSTISENNELFKNIIVDTAKKIKTINNNYNSSEKNNSLETPISAEIDFDTQKNTIQQNNKLFSLENGSPISNNNSSVKKVKKNLMVDMNPLDMMNQVITTNSNISENSIIQNNENNNDYYKKIISYHLNNKKKQKFSSSTLENTKSNINEIELNKNNNYLTSNTINNNIDEYSNNLNNLNNNYNKVNNNNCSIPYPNQSNHKKKLFTASNTSATSSIKKYAKKLSILSELENSNNNFLNDIINDINDNNSEKQIKNDINLNLNEIVFSPQNIPNETLSKLRNWLISCDLLCYYNILIKNDLYDIDDYLKKIKKNEIEVSYRDIEDLGIKKPGHIFRFLLKIQKDIGILDSRLCCLINNKFSENKSLKISTSCNGITCCCFRFDKEKFINKTNITNGNDIFNFLKNKGLIEFKENFIHNGFDQIEYIIIQLFSKYNFNKEILTEYLHIYSEENQIKVLKKLYEEKRILAKQFNIDYDDEEEYKIINTTNGDIKNDFQKNEENSCEVF